MKTLRLLWIGLALLVLLIPKAVVAATVSTKKGSGISIEITSDLETIPEANAVPMRIRIQNHSDRDGSWRIGFGEGWRGRGFFENEYRVESGQTRTFEVVVPLRSDYSHQAVFANVEGPGVSDSGRVHFASPSSPHHGSSNSYGFVALSTDLSARSWEPLKKEADAKKSNLKGTTFDPAKLPGDWRGFSGVEWLILSESEWSRLALGVRSAIRQWVGSGGHLVVATTDPGRVEWSGFVFNGPESTRYGYGDVRTLVWNGKEVPPGELLKLIDGGSLSDRVSAPIKPEWSSLPGIGKFAPPKFLVVSVVIGLAVLLGPINFFWLAPVPYRQRLFWTTPLLSLGGTLFLFALIFLIDGIGGYGGRVTVLRLLPGANEAVVYQNQMARTGLLLSNTFSADEDVLMHSVELDRYPHGGEQNEGQAGNRYFGDWFRSRSIQAQRIAQVRPTRAAIHLVGSAPSGAPEVVSSFESTVEELFFHDKNGRYWRGKNLRTGEKRVLESVSAKEVVAEWRQTIKPITGKVGRMLKDESELLKAGGAFLAKLEPGNFPVETLRSIRWKDDRVIALGSVENAKGEKP